MGAFTDTAKAYLDGELTAQEFAFQVVNNIEVANDEQLKRLAEHLVKIPLS